MWLPLSLVAIALAAPAVAAVGRIKVAPAPWVGALLAALGGTGLAWAWASGEVSWSVPWLPSWDVSLDLSLERFGAPFALLSVGVGIGVVLYSTRYIPAHLEEENRSPHEAVWFHVLILAFMAAMVLLALTVDLFVLFIAFDLTAVCSWALIRFDRENEEARTSAVTALVLTAGTSVVFLIGAFWIHGATGTLSIPELARSPEKVPSGAVACLALACLAKSAQVPLHFWLPRAMVAPTPVSAYLHSAAMAASGVYVLLRIEPLLASTGWAQPVLLTIGFSSIAVGSSLALVQQPLKAILAGSTISQLGHVLVLVAFGGTKGVAGAGVYLIVHGLCKGALFLTAGAVTEATGRDRLEEVGGQARAMPALAVVSAVAAAGLAGIPLTAGFFKDELWFETAHEHGIGFALAALAGAALTLAYMLRFWWGIFAGERVPHGHPPPRLMTGVIGVLAVLILIGGVWPSPLTGIGHAAIPGSPPGQSEVKLAYHFDLRAANLLAVGAWVVGAAVFLGRSLWSRQAARIVEVLAWAFGPAAWYDRTVKVLDRASAGLHELEVRDLRDRIAAVLAPSALLIIAALIFGHSFGNLRVGSLGADALPLALGVTLAGGAGLGVLRAKRHLGLVLLMSCVGYGLTAAFAFSADPDVALVALLVETTFTLLFVAMLSRVPRALFERAEKADVRTRKRDRALAVVAAAVSFFVAWTTLSNRTGLSVSQAMTRLTPRAHAEDVVTAILTDFRGLDTMGEASVIAVVLIGIYALAREVRA